MTTGNKLNPSMFFGFVLKSHKTQTMQKFPHLPIEAKPMKLQAENAEERKALDSQAARPKQTWSRREGNSKHNLIAMERQKVVMELTLMGKMAEMQEMDKVLAKEEKKLKQLEKTMERETQRFTELLRENDKKSQEAKALSEREERAKQEKAAEIRRLKMDVAALKSEIFKLEEVLDKYKRYEEFLFEVSPADWQQKRRVQPDGEKPQGEGLESSSAGDPSSVRDDTPPVNNEGSESEPQLYFTDPQQLLDLLTELTEQNLSLLQNSARVEETLRKLRRSVEDAERTIAKDEEEIDHHIDFMKQKIEKEKKRGAELEVKIKLHTSTSTEEQDGMLEALATKVNEVYHSCVADQPANLSTLEKVAGLEKTMISLLVALETVPEEKLSKMMKLKESEKRTRQREEKLREQSEKQKERMERYTQRALADTKKTTGRKLMRRYLPVTRKPKVVAVETAPVEDAVEKFLFGSDDSD